jgi:hypothetical protein
MVFDRREREHNPDFLLKYFCHFHWHQASHPATINEEFALNGLILVSAHGINRSESNIINLTPSKAIISVDYLHNSVVVKIEISG